LETAPVPDHVHLPLDALPEPDQVAARFVSERAAEVLRPARALERLDEVAAWLAGWQRTRAPRVERVAGILFAGDHGVASAGVSAYPVEVTRAMVEALRAGVATANVMAEAIGADLVVIDVGVGRPTGDISVEAAMDKERFQECLEAGRSAVAVRDDIDLLVLGEMGIGNTTAASAVCAALFGGPAESWTGRGTGIDEARLAHKTGLVAAAARRVDGAHPVEVLRQVGGSELAAIAGAALEARRRSIPLLLDGFVVTAACAVLEVARPGALDHAIAGHCSAESGHRLLLEKMGKAPLLDLGLRLGEGSGAMAAVPLVRLAARCVTDVATFQEWGL
jgi:nicotinate-nucleotide--dimethylbenzimidazole phosphoribosyltransferase